MDQGDVSNKTIAELKAAGYLVVVWTPDEIGDANIKVSIDMIVQHGNQVLDDQNEPDR